MSKIIKSIGVAAAAAAVIGVGVGTASAGAVHQDAAGHQAVHANQANHAKAVQVFTKGFQVKAPSLPAGTFLKLTWDEANNIGGLDSGPAIGSTLQSGGTDDFEVTWFAGKDNTIKPTYRLFQQAEDGQSYDTGKFIQFTFDVNMWDTATLTVDNDNQNGLGALNDGGDPATAWIYVPTVPTV